MAIRQSLRSLRKPWSVTGIVLVGLLIYLPLANAEVQNSPWTSPWDGNTGGIGCNGGNTWHESLGTSSGYVYEYTKSWNVGYSGCGLFGPWASSEDLVSGLHGSIFTWTKSNGNYIFSVTWTIAFRISANQTGSSGCSPGSPSTQWSMGISSNGWNENTGTSFSSSNWILTIASGSLTSCPSTHSQTSSAQQYILDEMVWMTSGDSYQVRSALWLDATGSSSASSSGDATVDVWYNSGGQQNYALLDTMSVG